MSFYIFGCVRSDASDQRICELKLKELCARLKIVVSTDSLDDEDREGLLEVMGASDSGGLFFAIHSEPGDSDATALWLQARELAREVLRKEGIDTPVPSHSQLEEINIPASYYDGILASRLGAFINDLTSSFAAFDFAIALVDGGIETVRNCGEGDCLREILASLILPWDCTRNAVYVFHRKA